MDTAMAVAIRLLTRRDHTCQELCRKLERRGFETQTIAAVIADCRRLHYLDDSAYARAYLRRMTSRGYGQRRIRMEMRRKGLAAQDIETALSGCDMEAEEASAARNILSRKANTLRHLTDDRRKRARLYRFLYSRGFSPDTIFSAMEAVLPTVDRFGD